MGTRLAFYKRHFIRTGTLLWQRAYTFNKLPVSTDTMVIRCFVLVSPARRAWLAFCNSVVFDQATLDAQE